MKTINLTTEVLDLEDLITLAAQEPILLVTSDGKEFLLAEADDFEQEVETLRSSPAFQQFLTERSTDQHRMSLDDLERSIEQELSTN